MMSEVTKARCVDRDDIADLLRGKSAGILRGAIQSMARAWRFSPADLELALRQAEQCRRWSLADAAWARYEAARVQIDNLPESASRTYEDWERHAALFAAQNEAFNSWQQHVNDADRLWGRPLPARSREPGSDDEHGEDNQ
jgi:hypothetical protein